LSDNPEVDIIDDFAVKVEINRNSSGYGQQFIRIKYRSVDEAKTNVKADAVKLWKEGEAAMKEVGLKPQPEKPLKKL